MEMDYNLKNWAIYVDNVVIGYFLRRPFVKECSVGRKDYFRGKAIT